MARGVAEWPELRGALLAGEVTWSAAEIVLRLLAPLAEARAALEAEVLERAEKHRIEQARRVYGR